LLYIEYPWFPVTCFETVFVSGWVNKSLPELRASRFKLFWGTPPSSRTQNRVCLAFLQFSHPTTPLFCHLYAGKKSFDLPPPSNTRSLRNIPICAVLNFS
jgi:hypothetical protein